MNTQIETCSGGTILILNIWFFISMPMGLVRGKKPDCLADEAPDDTLFLEQHHDEIGFVRDTCVELARNLHKTLGMAKATPPCTVLADTRTSTLWPFCKWNKWTRKGNKKVNDDVMKKALAMLQDFNQNVWKLHSIRDVQNQELITKCIDKAIKRLSDSGVADENPDIIKEMKQLKITFCQDYTNHLNHLQLEEEKAEAQRQREILEATQQAEAQRKQEELDNKIHNWAQNHKYPLHESVFEENIDVLGHLIRLGYGVNVKDKHGNTPLHLAVMLGEKTCIDLLLKHGASVRSKNLAGWNPVEEAISYGNRDTIPAVSWFLPSDHHRIYKQGQSLRVDSSLAGQLPNTNTLGAMQKVDEIEHIPPHSIIDFNRLQWIRRHVTMFLDESDSGDPCLYEVNHDTREYGILGVHPKTEEEIVKEANDKMSKDIASFHIPIESITFTRAKSGWIFSQDKSEMVGSFMTDFYTVNGLKLVSRKRREHLSEEQIEKNEAASIINAYARGYPFGLSKKTFIPNHESLPPPRCEVTWEHYINSEPGGYPALGRPIVIKEDIIPQKGEVGMSKDFPISTELIINILEVIVPFKQFSQVHEFVKANMPPGSLVKIVIPVLMTISVKYEFLAFEFKKHDEDVFKIPSDYKDVNYRFAEAYVF